MNIRGLLTISALIITSGTAAAQFLQPKGTAGASFLKITPSARSEALGRSYCGLSDDASAVFFNPGGLMQMESPEIQFTNLTWFAGLTGNSITFARPGAGHAFSMNLLMYQCSDKVRTLSGGQVVEGDTINLRDMALSLSYAMIFRKIRRYSELMTVNQRKQTEYMLGFTLKYINEQLYTLQSTAFAADAGLIIHTVGSKSTYGISVHNIGTPLGGDSLPLILRLGNCVKSGKDLFTWELCQESDADTRLGIGYESLLSDSFRMRIGGFYQEEINFSAGIGIRSGGFMLDYTYLPAAKSGFDSTHNMTLSVKFN